MRHVLITYQILSEGAIEFYSMAITITKGGLGTGNAATRAEKLLDTIADKHPDTKLDQIIIINSMEL